MFTTNWFKHIKDNYRPFDILFFASFLVIIAAYFEYIPTGAWQNPLSTTPPLLMVVPLSALAFYRFVRKERIVLHIGLLLFTSALIFIFSGNGSMSSLSSDKALRICSWNTAYFFQARKDQKDMREDGFKILKESHCDVVMLQEVWNAQDNLGSIRGYAKKYFPSHDVHVGSEFVILTPQGATTAIEQSSTRAFLGATVTINTRTIQLVNVHLWNPLVDRPYIAEDGSIKYRDSLSERARQSEDLFQYVSKKSESAPSIIMVGDFNTLPTQKLIRTIASIGKGDNHLTLVGTPWWNNRATYPANSRIMQIDYAYVSKNLQPNVEKSLHCYPAVTDHCLLFLEVLL